MISINAVLRRWALPLFTLLSFSSLCFAETPWETYVASPGSENSRLVETISYTTGPADSARLTADLGVLGARVKSEDPQAVDLAFRLSGRTEGAAGDMLSTMLGNLIRSNPKLFLIGLNKNRKDVRSLDPILGNLGEHFTDRFKAQAHEEQKRLDALHGVTEPRLIAVRDECVQTLQRMISAAKTSATESRK